MIHEAQVPDDQEDKQGTAMMKNCSSHVLNCVDTFVVIFMKDVTASMVLKSTATSLNPLTHVLVLF